MGDLPLAMAIRSGVGDARFWGELTSFATGFACG